MSQNILIGRIENFILKERNIEKVLTFLNQLMLSAIKDDNLNELKILTLDPQLIFHSNPYYNNHEGLSIAATHKSYKCLDYLINTPEFYQNNTLGRIPRLIRYHTQKKDLLKCSLIFEFNNDVEGIKILSKKNINIEHIFRMACIHKSEKIVDFFIIEKQLQLTEKTLSFLRKEKLMDQDYLQQIIEKVNINNNFSQLNQDIKNQEKQKSIFKI